VLHKAVDVAVVEIGPVVGDIESLPFMEAGHARDARFATKLKSGVAGIT
jgi:CTP synthase (UTP-ammonia lyase)